MLLCQMASTTRCAIAQRASIRFLRRSSVITAARSMTSQGGCGRCHTTRTVDGGDKPVIGISIKADLKPMQRAFVALGAKQAPFATSLALNALAKGVSVEETKAVDQTFKSPTPFTERAFRVEVATKSRPIAVVAAKDIQAQYLAPYVVGGDRFLGTKRGMLAPRGVSLNQYGNLSKGKLASLKGKPNIFIGPITTKAGKTINGVWQRPAAPKVGKRRGAAVAAPAGHLKLLIQFEDTTPAPKHLPFFERARAYVKVNAAREFGIGTRRALATAR